MQLTPAQLEQIRLRAEADMVRRKREGNWSAGVQAHIDYQTRPEDWIVEFLGVPRETLRWSLNEGYERCGCAECVARKHDGPHQWDGHKDPIARILTALAEGRDCGVESATGTGKAQPVDELVLTPVGWRPIGTLRPGDFVIGSNGRRTKVRGVYPQGCLPIYRLRFSDGAETRACGEHLWAVQSKADAATGREPRILSTDQLRDPSYLPGHESWRVPLPAPIDMPERDLQIDPYVLGVLLGDGSYTRSTPRLSSADPEIIAAVEAATGLTAHRRDDRYGYDLCDRTAKRNAVNPLMQALRDLGLAGQKAESKSIPADYLWASPAQRLALLQGLLDTDGSVQRGHPKFASASKALAEGVVHLVRSLGGVASLTCEPAFRDGARCLDSYRVHARLPEGVAPFRLARKLEKVRPAHTLARTIRSIEPDGEAECVCIQVAASDQLYVTNDFIVTHNTFIAACIMYWFLAAFEDSIVISAAPKEDQLLLGIWKEIGRLWPRFQRHFPQAELLTGKIRMKPAEAEKEVWAASAFPCGVGANEESATKAQGIHAEHLLIITEETPGIHSAIMNAFENTRTDDHNLQLALGNPDNQHDSLHVFSMQDHVEHVRISALDHPNVVCQRAVVPGAIGAKRLEQRTTKYGKGSRLYQSRVRGISPSEAADSLIKWEWCVAAAKKWDDPTYREGPQALGVDVANSEKGDRGAISRWQGACCTEVVDFPCPDANILGAEVVIEARAKGIDPRHVGVDSVGVGAGTVNEAKRLGFKLRELSGGRKAVPGLLPDVISEPDEDDAASAPTYGSRPVVEAERFLKLRSQVWYRLREDLRMGLIALPNDEALFHDLTTPTYRTNNGMIAVETKEEIQKRLKRSPNKGDACAYGNFVRPRRPERKKEEPIPESTRSRDYGLERLADRQAKRQAAEARQFQRMFKAPNRSRR